MANKKSSSENQSAQQSLDSGQEGSRIEKEAKEFKRRFEDNSGFHHDLYQLSTEKFQQNKSYTPGVFDLFGSDHQHWYHSVDPSGRHLTRCSQIGGHTHEMIPDGVDEEGTPKFKCGPPMKEGVKKINGRLVKGFVKIPYDDHTHEVVYIKSMIIKPRKLNHEAIKVQQVLTPQPRSVQGVIG